MDASDAALVGAARDGRREAYEVLIRRYAGAIAAVCRSKLGPRGPVDDMVQETFLRGYRAIATLTDPQKIGSWLHGIALRTCLDWIKDKERTEVSFDAVGAGPDALQDRSRRLEPDDGERPARVLGEVHALPEIYRETILLFYYQKQSYEEMGRMLGISAAAVNARLTKARAMLRERLARTVER
ncbi:MAG TPA: RNA polymerase sigma factor [Planctomycetota bacterium]|nr:RNA polymerase sigma factor [Planctomycetota bacterium]